MTLMRIGLGNDGYDMRLASSVLRRTVPAEVVKVVLPFGAVTFLPTRLILGASRRIP